MCLECFKDYTIEPTTEKISKAAVLIKELYGTYDGAVGGYGHVVFDDWNLDCIEGCLNDAKENKYKDDLCEETRQASIKALEYCKGLTENELANALLIKKRTNERS